MKQFKILIFSLLIGSLTFTSCLKEGPMNVDIDETTANVLTLQFIEGGGGSTINSGLRYFSGSALTYPATEASHVATFNVAINGAQPLKADVPVTLAIDATRAKDNFANDAIPYEMMPDSLYKLETTSVTIPAATRVVPVKITFYPAKINPTKSFILPVTIKDGSGQVISGNHSTIYFHVIGNPLAGIYNVTGTRYNYSGVIGYTGGAYPTNYISTAASPSPKTATPNSPTEIALDYANLGGSGYQYLITYNPANPTAIDVTGNKTFLDAVSNFAVLVKTYDPVRKQIRIVSVYNNALGGAGSDRIIDETFTLR
jgi:hypothetical protein